MMAVKKAYCMLYAGVQARYLRLLLPWQPSSQPWVSFGSHLCSPWVSFCPYSKLHNNLTKNCYFCSYCGECDGEWCGGQVLVTAFTVVPSRSGAVRTFEQRTVLEQFNPRCVAVSLSGYIFFGGSVKISDKVMEVRPCTDAHCQFRRQLWQAQPPDLCMQLSVTS